jgi:hypothetical protein
MQVFTKFVNMDFVIGSMHRDGNDLVIKSDTTKSMPAEVVMTPADAVGMIKAALNWSVIWFVLALPYLYFKAKRTKPEEVEDE